MQLVIYGTGKQAELTHYFFTHDSPHEVVAFCVEARYLPSTNLFFRGLPLIAFEELSILYPPSTYQLHIAVGQVQARQRLFESSKNQGYILTSYISSHALVWPDLVLGEHIFIEGRTYIHPFVTIGDNAFFFDCKIGHHSVLGSHVLLSGCTLGGSVTVGDGSFIGMGAVLNEKVAIGKRNIIGAGALLNLSTGDDEVYTGQYSKRRLADASRVTLFR